MRSFANDTARSCSAIPSASRKDCMRDPDCAVGRRDRRAGTRRTLLAGRENSGKGCFRDSSSFDSIRSGSTTSPSSPTVELLKLAPQALLSWPRSQRPTRTSLPRSPRRGSCTKDSFQPLRPLPPRPRPLRSDPACRIPTERNGAFRVPLYAVQSTKYSERSETSAEELFKGAPIRTASLQRTLPVQLLI